MIDIYGIKHSKGHESFKNFFKLKDLEPYKTGFIESSEVKSSSIELYDITFPSKDDQIIDKWCEDCFSVFVNTLEYCYSEGIEVVNHYPLFMNILRKKLKNKNPKGYNSIIKRRENKMIKKIKEEHSGRSIVVVGALHSKALEKRLIFEKVNSKIFMDF